ncbi:MAG TPA: tRNA (adenosine(37)-N6)-dimethylallyltransferase MiaA [Gammaproteobacteria bacterium]|nr:tRNA (adenosine(37)-N6)-dimethylallyltransferase MiaA [Gammaproteobacteria bacterium]
MPDDAADSAEKPRCFCLTAPTACGKTDLALELARRLPIEIVSVDSAMVYRGMDIGTAKPDAELRAAVPHHLIDVADPAEPYSAGRFLEDARAAIDAIRGRGRMPLLVGGTLLYLRALRQGLASLPKADARLRAELEEEAARRGWPALHGRLTEIDPQAARRIAPNDRQRIQRALEVYELTGRPLTALQSAGARQAGLSVEAIALVPPSRDVLAERIERRFDAMADAGFVTEVRQLRARGDLSMDTPSMRAVGYRQVWGYLAGGYDWPTARAKAITATRQLAKRQMTWLRSEQGLEKLDAFAPNLTEKLLKRIGSLPKVWS